MNITPSKLEAFTKVAIVLVATLAVVAGFFLDKISGETFLALIGPIVGYYFSERKNEKVIKSNEETIQELKTQNIILKEKL